MKEAPPLVLGYVRWVLRIVSVLCVPFILAGLGMVGWAAVELLERRTFLAGAARAQGVVVGFVPSDSADEPRSCAIVEFEAGGARRRFQDAACYSVSPLSEGQQVVVVYDRSRPEKAEIASSWLSLAWVALGAGGLALVVMGALGVAAPLWLSRRTRLDRLMQASGRLP